MKKLLHNNRGIYVADTGVKMYKLDPIFHKSFDSQGALVSLFVKCGH